MGVCMDGVTMSLFGVLLFYTAYFMSSVISALLFNVYGIHVRRTVCIVDYFIILLLLYFFCYKNEK